MPRIAELTLDQVNRQVDVIDNLRQQVADVQKLLNNVAHQVTVADPIHAPQTTNNMVFTWTGGSTTLSWVPGYVKDKNWNVQIVTPVPQKSSAPGQQHFFGIPAGSLSLTPSTFYWLAWNVPQQTMQASQDVSTFHTNFNTHIICQIFTGTGGQSGTAGGGGSTGGVDLSGIRYKNF